MIEYLRWRWRLWLAARGERIYQTLWREDTLATRWPVTWFDRLIDRVSPWSHPDGYRRVGLRRWLYRLRHPRLTVRRAWLRLARRVIARLLPEAIERRGRYEGNDGPTCLKAEWLDHHSELSDDQTGDSDWYLWAAVFYNHPVPWSRAPEHWLLTVDTQGFVDATQYDSIETAGMAFGDVEVEYRRYERGTA